MENKDTLSSQFKRILVVDDSHDNCALMKAYFHGSPAELHFAHSSSEALEKYRESAFDALLLDYELPDENAPALCDKLRHFEKEKNRPAPPFFLLSGHKNPPGGHHFAAQLQKPLSRKQIFQTLNQWIENQTRSGGPMETQKAENTQYVVKVEKDLEDLVPNFVANRKKDVKLLGDWIESQNFEEIRRMGHTLKGVCASYGFPQLGEFGKELEVHAKSENLGEISKIHQKMADFMNHYQIQFI